MDDPEDLAALGRYADELAAGVEASLPGWVSGSVARVLEGTGRALDERARSLAAAAGRRAAAEVGPAVRRLLATDVDRQRTNPLSLLRAAVRYPTEVLERLDVAPVPRDAEARRLHPDDPYDLTPGSFRDLDESLHEPGIRWGAAKAHVVLARRRAEGSR